MKKPTPFGKYFLLERINVGGMAEVFRAKAFGVEGFERLVAVKRILPNIAEDKEFIRMFIEEAKLSVQLNHANIAQIFDLGVVDGSYYIALEHVHGRDLRGIFDRCRQLGETMPVAQACFIAMKLCEGLDYAHNKRDPSGRELSLVHRDVSPQNVLVSFEGEVKIIDFGIAKAAGKGSKTQAGILKGKFGYMSPEQVRGLPVDRRSDVFSCGIVLYELLTGERLFVGESDFSTLEKVRNVEILPPSTYNRKIPDELERIVLKALAKDVEDRYQNAIDLHDELQAFVYTAGEFYSRKDLAAWMKKTFGKEIDEESAKLEGYRQLKPPPPPNEPPPPIRAASSSQKLPIAAPTPPPLRRSQLIPSVPMPAQAKPPPPPLRTSQQMAAVAAPPPTPPPPVAAAIAAPPVAPAAARTAARRDDADLAWDDDELETQIYDNPEDDPKNKAPGRTSKPLPLQAPGAAGALAAAAASQPASASSGSMAAMANPDLSSLVSTAKGWEAGPPPSPASTLNGIGNGRAPKLATGSNQVMAPEPPPPAPTPPPSPAVSSQLPVYRPDGPGIPVPFESGPMSAMQPMHPPPQHGPGPGPGPGYPTGDYSQAGGFPPSPGYPGPAAGGYPGGGYATGGFATGPFDPMGSYAPSMTQQRRSRKKLALVLGVGGVAAAAVTAAVVIAVTRGDSTTTGAPAKAATTASAPTGEAAPATPTPPPVDQNTGFDLYVAPAGISKWKLDGEPRTDRLPSRIRGIAPGSHSVQIDGPPGFVGRTQTVEVVAGKADRVDIKLDIVQGIHGVFESTPPGATVSLIVDGKRQQLGASPQRAPLDPRSTYQVLFEKPGYVSVNRPIVFGGTLEEKTTVTLEKAGAVAAATPTPPPAPTPPAPAPPAPAPPTRVATTPTTPPPAPAPTPRVDPPAPTPPRPPAGPTGTGTLALGSKPACEIYVDGASTGLYTPQPAMKLPAGRRRITLVNNDFGIKESFVVDINPDKPAKMIKDYSDKLPR